MEKRKILKTTAETRVDTKRRREIDMAKIEAEVRKLAVFKEKQNILKGIEESFIIIIDGFTGCGKTTQIPKFIYQQFKEQHKKCKIVVTEPRRIAATSAATRVALELGTKMKEEVGYQIGKDNMSSEDTIITYMTTEILLQKLIQSKSFVKLNLTHLIIDEVHERDLITEILLLVILKILIEDKERKESNVKIVLMSATLSVKEFVDYFSKHNVATPRVIGIPKESPHVINGPEYLENILSLEELEDMDQPTNDNCFILHELFIATVKIIVGLDSKEFQNKTKTRGSVLVFLPGVNEIDELQSLLIDAMKDKNRNWTLFPLHSLLDKAEQKAACKIPVSGTRHIIIATNIAESSLTIPDVAYVIDFCTTRAPKTDKTTNYKTLQLGFATQSQCNQRMGRTGRTCDGHVYRMVTRELFNKLTPNIQSQIDNVGLEDVILKLKKNVAGMGRIKDLLDLAIQPPEELSIECAIAKLKELGAMEITTQGPQEIEIYDKLDGKLTDMGHLMADLPIPLNCARLVWLGHCFGLMKYCTVLAAAAIHRSPFMTPTKNFIDPYLSALDYSKNSFSDLITAYHLYAHWKNNVKGKPFEKDWVTGACVNKSVLLDMDNTVGSIMHSLFINYKPFLDKDLLESTYSTNMEEKKELTLKILIAGAWYPNYFRKPNDTVPPDVPRGTDLTSSVILDDVDYRDFDNQNILAARLTEHLSFGRDIPTIQFHGSTAIATFSKNGEKHGEFHTAVYRTLQMQQLGHKFFMSHCNSNVRRSKETCVISQVSLPTLEEEKIEVIISHVESLSKFWVVRTMPKYGPNREQMDEICNDPSLCVKSLYPSVNAVVLVTHHNRYCRGQVQIVIGPPIGEALIYLVDKGSSQWYKTRDIICFNTSYKSDLIQTVCKSEFLAMQCRLSEIVPVNRNVGWSTKAEKEFHNFANRVGVFYIKVQSVVNSVVACEIINVCNTTGIETSFHDILRRSELGEDLDEGGQLTMETNGQLRQRVQKEGCSVDWSEEYIRRLKHNQIGNPPAFWPQQTITQSFYLDKKPNVISNPLEFSLNFQCVRRLFNSDYKHTVKPDRDSSLNCVILNNIFKTKNTSQERFIVGVEMKQLNTKGKTSHLVAFHVTLMPPKNGLLPLILLLFTPKYNMNPVQQKAGQMTGAIFGFGNVPSLIKKGKMERAYGKCDFTHKFEETVFDKEDLENVETIRVNLCNIFKDITHGTSNSDLTGQRISIRMALDNLLSKERVSLETKW